MQSIKMNICECKNKLEEKIKNIEEKSNSEKFKKYLEYILNNLNDIYGKKISVKKIKRCEFVNIYMQYLKCNIEHNAITYNLILSLLPILLTAFIGLSAFLYNQLEKTIISQHFYVISIIILISTLATIVIFIVTLIIMHKLNYNDKDITFIDFIIKKYYKKN